MDLDLLAEEYAKDPDFTKLVAVPRGRIERFEVKVYLLALGPSNVPEKTKYQLVVEALPAFAEDPDFAMIDVLHPVSAAVFDGLVTANVLTQAERDGIAALGYENVPRWKALGWPEHPHDGDIAKVQEMI